MESHSSDLESDARLDDYVPAAVGSTPRGQVAVDSEAAGAVTEKAARARVFDEVLAGVELVLAADGVAFWREESDHSLVLTASRSIPSDVLDALDGHVVGPLQSIMQRWPDSPLVAIPLEDASNPIAEEIRSVAEKAEIVGIAGVPCRIPGEMLGLLMVIHRRPHPWTVRDLGLATGFAGQLATAMQNSRLYASVRSLANRLTAIHELSLRLASLRDVDAIVEAIVTNAETHVTVSTRADLDAMTGLRNQGTFQRDLQSLIDTAGPFSLLMMDLDSFKAFNDTYGHPAGDALLQTVAKAIVGATRQNDRAYRYGGDEFALLLVGASRHHAEEVAGRVRVAVREAIRRGEGFWGRLWDSGGVHTENEASSGVLLGLPITVEGRVAGLIGVALPAAAMVAPERLRMLDHLAALAGAAVQRLGPPAT